MKPVFLIVNPCSGKNTGARKLAEVISVLNRAGYSVETYITAAAGEARPVAAARTAEDTLAIACIGGDGTLNEVVSGILDSGSGLPLGYIPAGSTNDFASTLGLPKQLKKSAALVAEFNPVAMDIGRFADRYFTYIASFGIFTRTSYATPQKMKNLLGHAAYILAAAKELGNIRKYNCALQLDDDEILDGDWIFGAVSNSTSVAGVLKLDGKQMDLHDGLFEVIMVKYPKSAKELEKSIEALLKNDFTSDRLIFRKAKKIRVLHADFNDWTLDGEHGDCPDGTEIENLHDSVQLLL